MEILNRQRQRRFLKPETTTRHRRFSKTKTRGSPSRTANGAGALACAWSFPARESDSSDSALGPFGLAAFGLSSWTWRLRQIIGRVDGGHVPCVLSGGLLLVGFPAASTCVAADFACRVVVDSPTGDMTADVVTAHGAWSPPRWRLPLELSAFEELLFCLSAHVMGSPAECSSLFGPLGASDGVPSMPSFLWISAVAAQPGKVVTGLS